MAFLNEVGGKINSKTLLIGDGVDKIHSPLQVLPQMATGLMNLTSNLYPSLSVRNGRTNIMLNSLNLGDLSLTAAASYLDTVKPFVDSAGTIHYALIFIDENATPDNLHILWYALYTGMTVPEYLGDIVISCATYLSTDPMSYYSNINFCEYKSNVYLFHKYTTGSVNKLGYSLYQVAYHNFTTSYGATSTTVDRVSPSCIYLDKAFFSDGVKLYWSATGVPTDFTTVMDSGYTELSQGGKITALMPMRDRLLISTEKALFVLFGSGYDSFSVSLLADNIGISNPKCITQKNGVVYFSADDGDVYEYDGTHLYNLTREPMQTGSKSYVKGGYPHGHFVPTSISIQDNALYCVDDRRIVNTTYKDIYVFDIVQRRWYEQDYPYSTTSMLFFWNTTFCDNEKAYFLEIETWFLETVPQITQNMYLADNGTEYTSQYLIDIAGTKQKVKNTVLGNITGDGSVYVQFKYKPTPLIESVILSTTTLVTSGMTPAQTAAAVLATLNATSAFTMNFVGSVVGDAVVVETKYYVGNLATYFKINNDSCTGLTASYIETVTSGVLNTYKTTSVQNVAPFFWISPAYQLTPTGKQMLKAIHFSYYSPSGTELSVYTSNTLDLDDFVKIRTLPISALHQSGKFVLPVNRNGKNDWLRIKLAGTGNIKVYNMTMDWRILEKVR